MVQEMSEPTLRPLADSDPARTQVAVTDDRGDAWLTFTRSPVWWAGTARLVLLEGRTGGYDASRVEVIE
jgi:hypothetical protein